VAEYQDKLQELKVLTRITSHRDWLNERGHPVSATSSYINQVRPAKYFRTMEQQQKQLALIVQVKHYGF